MQDKRPSGASQPHRTDPTHLRPEDSALSDAKEPTRREAPTLAKGDASEWAETKTPTARQVGDYLLESEIARGGMGVVYRAKQQSLNRQVALKMILAGQLASEEDRIRFQTEAEAAAKLDHPGIVPIYEVGSSQLPEGEQYYYSMAFIEGKSLAEKVSQGPLAPRTAAELMIDVCHAVHYAHGRGIIHRDLKPANILLDLEGRPRITDFGLAKNVDGDSQLTATGQIMGTPSYMPPEQVSGKSERIGPHSDVYALGAILYCLLTGKPPFQGDTLLETLTQVLDREPEPPSFVNEFVDADLETICLKCLEKDENERFQQASELADELQRFLDGVPIESRKISAWERVQRWRKMIRRNPDIRIESRTKVFGWPLVSIAFGRDSETGEERGTAKGVIAYGDRAFGLIAMGTVAYGLLVLAKHARGGICWGLTSIGLFSFGLLSLGIVSMGGVAIGWFSVGMLAIGHLAIGMFSLGWKALGAFCWRWGP